MERGEGVSADDMINLMADLFAEGYGGEMEVNQERVGITWAQFGHLFVDYYVFQYATGISGAHAIAQRILNGEPGAVEGLQISMSCRDRQYEYRTALEPVEFISCEKITPCHEIE